MKSVSSKILVIVLILFLALLYHYQNLNEFPSHIHAWAQSDRYALSLGFLDNGLNFFKPQTFVYNHQFPSNWSKASEYSITAVDFPIHDFVPALMMKITASDEPWVFRLYVLIYSLFGLFFLFKISYSISTNYYKSIFVVVFAATSPVFVYYQNGFLPTIPSLSNTIIGLYFYIKHLDDNKQRSFIAGIFFLTLASLARTTFIIPFIAVLCVELIRMIKKETRVAAKIAVITISFFLLGFYQLYNGYLREKYGSVFLNHFLPPNNWDDFLYILTKVYTNWGQQYFTTAHYLIFPLLVLTSIIFFFKTGPRFSTQSRYLVLFVSAYFWGCIMFAAVMLKQFSAHDYYFLDTFFLPVILLLIILFSLIPQTVKGKMNTIFIVFLLIVSVYLIYQPIKTQENRRTTSFWDKTGATIRNFDGSAAFLDSLGISKDSKILVMDAVCPNIPFILMERKGFVVMNTTKENIETALNWDYDVIIFQNEYFISDIFTPFPDILTRLVKVADNGNITVCKLSKTINPQTLSDFIGVADKTPLLTKCITFDEKPDIQWHNTNSSDKFSYSGLFSGHLLPEHEFGLTFKTKDLSLLTGGSSTLLMTSYFLSKNVANCELVTSIQMNGQNVYYKSYNLKTLLKDQNNWEKVSLLFQLPALPEKDYELAVFLWNTGKNELFYDNFTITIY